MDERDIKSLYNQFQMLYGYNWKVERPLNIRCLGVSGYLKELVDKYDARKWKLITFEDSKLDEVKDIVPCVYLTAESDTVLETLDPSKYYIIGGIVDHNKYKGLCEGKANALKIQTARLPIQENVSCIGRKVLTVNQVFNIIAEYAQSKDWKVALEAAMPHRKIVQEKQSKNEGSDSELTI